MMATALHLYQPIDALNRRVLFAVELVDPVTQMRISRRIKVKADGLVREPITNRSGRFVWLMEDAVWPTNVTVTSDDPRFMSTARPAPPRPADLEHATEKERLLRIELQPTRVYDFGEGVTAIRGALATSLQRNAQPIFNAEVALAWHDELGNWHAPASPTKTDERGQFAVFVRLPSTPVPDLKKGLLLVRLQIANENVVKTTANFEFLMGQKDFLDRIPEGMLLYRDVPLGWAEL